MVWFSVFLVVSISCFHLNVSIALCLHDCQGELINVSLFWINCLSAIRQYAADRYTCTMSFLLIAVSAHYLLVPGICGLNMFVCVCIRDAFQGCVWDAAQVSVGVCCTTSLQGTGYQAEREAYHVNYFTHTPSAKRATQLLRTHKHTRTCTWAFTLLSTHTHTYTQNQPSFFHFVVFLSSHSRCVKTLDINSLLLSRKIVLYSNQFNSILWN